MLSAIVIGSTGAVGEILVQKLIKNENVEKVVALTRRLHPDFPENDEKFTQVVCDLDNLDEVREHFEGKNAAYCCLGTQVKTGKENFLKVDFEYCKAFATIAKETCDHINLVSSSGANSSSWFLYLKTKGQTEEAYVDLGFKKTSIYRPGPINRKEKARTKEKLFNILGASIDTETIAEGMIQNSLSFLNQKVEGGTEYLSSSEISRLTKT